MNGPGGGSSTPLFTTALHRVQFGKIVPGDLFIRSDPTSHSTPFVHVPTLMEPLRSSLAASFLHVRLDVLAAQ